MKRYLRLVVLVSIALGLAACAGGGPPAEGILIFDRANTEADASCFSVCRDRLDNYGVDDCVDIMNEGTAAGVACVLAPDSDDVSMRLETLVAGPGETLDCIAMCGNAIPGDDSDRLVDCAEVVTEDNQPAALCAMKWATPSSGAW